MPPNGTVFDISTKVQIYGVLLKRPFGHQSTKWSKRFFVVKDGFLLYYADNEKKDFEKRRQFNIHPKGVIPLGNCVVESASEPTQHYTIHIKNDEDFSGIIMLAAESDYEREKWLTTLRQSSRITWKNAQLGDCMIQQLETQGLELAREKQNYFDMLQNESVALNDERERKELLEKENEELEKEKQKMEQLAEDLQDEYSALRIQLDDTMSAMQCVEEEKQQLNKTFNSLQDILMDLEREKNTKVTELNQRDELAKKLEAENKSLSNTKEKLESNIKKLEVHASASQVLSLENEMLSKTTEELKSDLKMIEERTNQILEEKLLAENRLKEKEEIASQLQEEKLFFNQQAEELQASITEITTQKDLTEVELREEVKARIDAERRLQQAETALGRLDKAVRQGGNKYTDEDKEEMIVDVKKLKRFFETVAMEAKIDADKPIIMKNAVHARKSFAMRAQTLKIDKRKKKSRSLVANDESMRQIRRAATFMATDRNIRQHAIRTMGLVSERESF